MTDRPRYPWLHVDLGDLDGPDGNAFMVIGKVGAALQQAGLPNEVVTSFCDEAVEQDSYENVHATVARWVKVVER